MPSGFCQVEEFRNRNFIPKNHRPFKKTADMDLMKCQSFWITLIRVDTIYDVMVKLKYNGDFLKCITRNLYHIQVTFEETLRRHINEEVIIFVHDVKNNALEVSFYDNHGMKIELLATDLGRFDNVTLPLEHPVLYRDLYGCVTANEGDTMYIIPSDQHEEYRVFQEEMAWHYGRLERQRSAVLPVMDSCYAIRDAVNPAIWHRVVITQETEIDDTLTQVQYIDTGVIDEAKVKSLHALEPAFMRVAKFCIPIDVMYAQEACPTGTDIILRGLRKKSNSTLSEFEGLSIDIRSLFSLRSISLERPDIPVRISDVHVPYLYINFTKDIPALDEKDRKLNAVVESLPNIKDVTIGTVCAAKWKNGKWYRAEVTDIQDSNLTVFYYDYGTLQVLKEDQNLKELPPEFLMPPSYATTVKLRIDPVDGEWVDDAKKIMHSLISKDHISMKVISMLEDVSLVDILDMGYSVTEQLVRQGYAHELVPARISRVISPNEFYLEKTDEHGVLKAFGQRLDWDDIPHSSGRLRQEHTIRSSLKLLPKGEEWSVGATEIICDLQKEESVTVLIMGCKNERTRFVKLYSHGVDVEQDLLTRGLAVYDSAEPFEEHSVLQLPPIKNSPVTDCGEEW